MSDKNNTSLLDEAVADAQLVLDTAIANAEATLTEKFRPELKNLLAKHIQQEMDGEDIDVQPDDLEDYRDDNGDVDDEDRYDDYDIEDIDEEEEIDLDIPDDEYEGDEDEEDEEDDEKVEEEEEEDEMDYEDEEEEMLSQEIAKLESMIADLKEEDDEEEEDMDDMDFEDEDEYEDEEEEMEEVYEFDLNEFIDGQMNRDPEIDAEDGHEDELSLDDEGEGIDVGSTYDIEGEPVTFDLHGDLTTEGELDIDGLLDEITDDTSDLAENAELQAQNAKLRKEVKKHKKAIGKMRGKLQEVGLLNAKLLYTNKIFRSFNLKEDQKVKVLKQFDNADSMKEAKIIFKTLSESLDQGATRKNISESVNRRLSSSQSSTKPQKEIISDSNDLKSRFKKLANINN